MSNLYKYFISDLVIELKSMRSSTILPVDEFEKGRLYGIYECLDLMVNQAKSFQIELSEIGLDDIALPPSLPPQ